MTRSGVLDVTESHSCLNVHVQPRKRLNHIPGAQTFLSVCLNYFLVNFAVARTMGCAISGLAPKTAGESKTEDSVAHLSKEQIEMIKESWKVIQEDIAKVGIILFVR